MRNNQNQQTILLVEDEVIIAMHTERTLAGFGYDVVTANSGREAVKLATESEAISLILMDIKLGGGMDGTEAAEQILAVRHMPIVFVTSHMEEEYVARVKEITRYGYVIKNSGNFVLKSSIEMAFELFKQHEKTRQSEEKYRTLLHNIEAGVTVHSSDTRIVTCNQKSQELLGFTQEQLLGKAATDPGWNFLADDGTPMSFEVYPVNRVLESGQSLRDLVIGVLRPNCEEVVWCMTNADPIFNSRGDVEQIIVTFMDITERKKAHEKIQKQNEIIQIQNEKLQASNDALMKTLEKLRESEEIIQAAMDQSQAGIAIADAPDGKLRYVNDAGLLIRGGSRAEIVEGIGVEQYVASWRILHLDGTPYKRDEVPLARAVLYGETCREEFIIRRDDNEDRIVLAHAAPIYDANGNITAGIVVFLDITERKKAEEALQKSERELREANDTQNTFFSIIAHDLRNPVLALKDGTVMLKTHLQKADDAFAQKISGELHKKSNQLSDLLENLLDWSRMQRGKMPYKPEKTDLYYVANYIIELLKANAQQKEIDLACSIKAATFVYADDDMLQAVFRNLISNAIKYTRNGGEVTVSAQERGGFVEVTVIDNGVGLSTRRLENLFKVGEQRMTTPGTAGEKGTGLGLILCKEFVEKHGGQIWAEGKEGHGSTFKFTVPVRETARG